MEEKKLYDYMDFLFNYHLDLDIRVNQLEDFLILKELEELTYDDLNNNNIFEREVIERVYKKYKSSFNPEFSKYTLLFRLKRIIFQTKIDVFILE